MKPADFAGFFILDSKCKRNKKLKFHEVFI